MLDAITLDNFKAFKKLDNLRVKPITVLCGTNSCGKSSILQSLLLCKQTLESRNPNQTILLNGRLVRLGTFEGIVFEKKPRNSVVLSFSFRIPRSASVYQKGKWQKIRFAARQVLSREGVAWPKLQMADYMLHFEISLRVSKKTRAGPFIRPVIVDHLILKIAATTEQEGTISETIVEMRLKRGGS